MDIDITQVQIIEGDLSDSIHQKSLVDLTNAYLSDIMGDNRSLSPDSAVQLVLGLAKHPAALLFFAEYQNKLIGLATCFVGFSTFYAKKLVNIHDLVVLTEYRRQGVAKNILLAVEKRARSMGCCKITLEVREDNIKAMRLYLSQGFSAGEHPMLFWTKIL